MVTTARSSLARPTDDDCTTVLTAAAAADNEKDRFSLLLHCASCITYPSVVLSVMYAYLYVSKL
jgi:hypothetical protein